MITQSLNTAHTTLAMVAVTTTGTPAALVSNLTACAPGSRPPATTEHAQSAMFSLQESTVFDRERRVTTVTAPPIATTTEDRRDALRRRRLVPPEHFIRHASDTRLQATSLWVTPSWQQDDIVSERISTRRWRTDYHLADAFAALSNMSRPGEHVAALAEKLYEASSDASLTSEQRDIFRTTGATFDLLSIFVPHVWIMKTAGTAGGIVAKALRNETITAQDILDINGAFKGVVDQGVQNAIAHQSTLLAPATQPIAYKPGMVRTPRYSDLITQLYFQKTFGAVKSDMPQNPSKENQRSGLPDVLAADPSVFEAPPEAARAIDHDQLVISLDEQAIRKAPARQTVVLQNSPPGQHAAEEHPSAINAGVPEIVIIPADDALEISGSDHSDVAGSEHSDAAGSQLSASAEQVAMGARPALMVEETLPERRWSDVSRETLALRNRARVAAMRRKAQIDIAIPNAVPPPLSYASSDGIHLLLQADEAGQMRWQALPRTWYQTAVKAPEDQTGVFSIDEQAYVSIDDHIYAVRDISETAMQVFNPADISLPPLPVASVDGQWQFNAMLHGAVEGILTEAGIDGFIRLNNKKYVRINNQVFEVERASIGGEERIAEVAQSITEALPSSDACGYIRWRDDTILIEGMIGYYVVRNIEPFGVVVMMADDTPVPMHYDHVLGRWHVAPINGSARRLDGPLPLADEESSVVLPLTPRRSIFDSVAGLDIRSRIDQFPFSIHWPKLANALELSFERLARWRLIKPNRPHAFVSERPVARLYSIQTVRQAAYRLMPDAKSWNGLSVLVKQQKAAAFTEEVYKNYLYLEKDLAAEAMCSEMTELLMMKMTRRLGGKGGMFSMCGGSSVIEACFLEVRIKEIMTLGNTGRSHVALMAFKSRHVMEAGFGMLSTPHPEGSPRLKEMSNGEFRAFVHEHRYELLLMDPWGPKKVVDFGMAGGVDAALAEFLANLKEARFGDFTATIGYSVQAFVPPRSGLVSESGMEFDYDPFAPD